MLVTDPRWGRATRDLISNARSWGHDLRGLHEVKPYVWEAICQKCGRVSRYTLCRYGDGLIYLPFADSPHRLECQGVYARLSDAFVPMAEALFQLEGTFITVGRAVSEALQPAVDFFNTSEAVLATLKIAGDELADLERQVRSMAEGVAAGQPEEGQGPETD